jgi:tyrosine-protein phosphatase SIW14
MKRSLFFRQLIQSSVAISLICSLVSSGIAGSGKKKEGARGGASTSIDNYGQVNAHIYRGSQPKDEEYQELAAAGIKTVLDLREDAKSGSKADAEQAGLQYVNLPLGDKEYPQADAAQHFLEIVNDQTNWPVYVHCAGGRHRTGSMIAVYRMTVDHWTLDQAYAEMKKYDFYTSGGHGCYKDYVNDYYRDLQARVQTLPSKQESTISREATRF